MVKFLMNPHNVTPQEAITTFSHEDDPIMRMRFNFTDATTDTIADRRTASCTLYPESLAAPFMQPNKLASEVSDKSLCYPIGPAPTDAVRNAAFSTSDLRVPNRLPYNVGYYSYQYARYLVLSTTYRFVVENYEDFPIVFGYEILPRVIIHNMEISTDVSQMSAYGSEIPVDLNSLRLEEIRARDNVVVGTVPASSGSIRIARTTGAGAGTADTDLHVTPGKAVIEFTVDLARIYKDMARTGKPGLNFPDFDIEAYIGQYSSAEGTPAVLNPAYMDKSGYGAPFSPVSVQMFACAENTWYTDFQGTAATGNDHFNGLHNEGWGTACKNWTQKVNIRPRCTQKVLLLDPYVYEKPPSALPDVNPAVT